MSPVDGRRIHCRAGLLGLGPNCWCSSCDKGTDVLASRRRTMKRPTPMVTNDSAEGTTLSLGATRNLPVLAGDVRAALISYVSTITRDRRSGLQRRTSRVRWCC
jgi:hypothetical protein